MKAAAKVLIGVYAPKQQFIKNVLNDQDILDGGGATLKVTGLQELFTAMNIAGMGADKDDLAVVIDGMDDVDMDEDVLGEDVLGDDDDIDTINEDIDTVNDDDED